MEINYAKHLNPLSGLPGNMLIENKLKELLSAGAPFTVMYPDIDNFKAYNDAYSFERGDKMIQITADIIDKCVSEYVDSQDCFTGHIGGDDFVICVKGFEVEEICRSIISEFKNKMEELYSPVDYKNGYVLTNNRKGDAEEISNVTLSVACITNKEKNVDDIYELS